MRRHRLSCFSSSRQDFSCIHLARAGVSWGAAFRQGRILEEVLFSVMLVTLFLSKSSKSF